MNHRNPRRPALKTLVLPPASVTKHPKIILPHPATSSIDQALLTANHFQELEELGVDEGNSSITKVLHVPSNLYMARKRLKQNHKNYNQTMREVEISCFCDCARIVKCYGSHEDSQVTCISLYYELMDAGSLFTIYRTHGKIPTDVLAVVAIAVLEALDYLDRLPNKVIHRDVKPHNILANVKGEVKLCDFGVSRLLATADSIANTYVGTQCYMSPERLDFKTAERVATLAGDIWSLGLTLVELAAGRYPIPKLSEAEERDWMRNGRLSSERLSQLQDWSDYDTLVELKSAPPVTVRSEYFSVEFKAFVDNCLCMESKNRSTVAELQKMIFHTRASDGPSILAGWLAEKKEIILF